MEKIIEYLRAVPAFYVATVDQNNRPKVRPFSLVYEFEEKLSLGINDTKEVYRQLEKNPYLEICAFQPEQGTWMRVWGKVKLFKSQEANRRIFETMPALKAVYGDEKNDTLVAVSITEGQADLYSMASPQPQESTPLKSAE
ncbi:MAG: pyridoxamine 5'-phosphate oxidase family protein [Rikenellaceae bacterium]|nr:pyridoxamine 5'-phosphate oxidase family protein [Rikenellaceae bacterium]